MSLKVAAVLAGVGLTLVIASILYGRSTPTAGAPEKTQERIQTATSRHAHVVAATRAQERKKGADDAIEKLHEVSRKSAELTAERERTIAFHGFVTGALRYSGCIGLLAGALIFLAKTQS